MRPYAILGGILILFGLLGADNPQQPPAPVSGTSNPAGNSATLKPAAPPASRPEDEKAIRQIVAQLVKAYNAGDAQAVAKFFAPDAEIVDEEGRSVQGRAQVEEIFAGAFRNHPKTHIAIDTASIRFIGPATAVEDGMNTVVHAPGETALRSRYEIVYLRQEGKWQIGSARDFPDEPLPAEEQLKQLDWLVGEWIDESPESLILTKYHWADNHKFLSGDFAVQIKGRPAMSGTQRIGWDPVAQKNPLLGVRYRRRLRARDLDARRKPLDRQNDRRESGRQDGLLDERHHDGQQGSHDLAIPRSHRR